MVRQDITLLIPLVTQAQVCLQPGSEAAICEREATPSTSRLHKENGLHGTENHTSLAYPDWHLRTNSHLRRDL
ncbi:hypothetical protein C8F04DRAFT_1077114 [Mycena alexandri]|uniref:Uncharacterized protein n=1 Tax=Mycena alexandri TaxID=1745969 RepID=A0AAD6XBT2_9AGAR|nr:hypothetical protein C8F04DRAFT_1077114 [Mycena alexandri]